MSLLRITAAAALLLFVGSLSATAAPPASSGPSFSGDAGWQRVSEQDGVTLYSRGRTGSSLKEFKSVGTIPASSQAVEKLLSSVADYPRFMPYVTESRLISQEGNITISYQMLNVPFVSNRDYTVRVEHGVTATPAGTVFRDTWQAANEAGPAERHGVVRVKINEGSWLLEPTGPNTTRATYRIYTDSGGSLPAFLANRASQTVIPKVFAAIRKQAQDPKYSSAGPAASAH